MIVSIPDGPDWSSIRVKCSCRGSNSAKVKLEREKKYTKKKLDCCSNSGIERKRSIVSL